MVSLDRWMRMLAEGPAEGAERSRHICQLCAQLPGVSGAGISMVTATGNRGVIGAAVVSADPDTDRVRWPLFTSFALQADFRSVVALPLRLRLRLRHQTTGGLNLFDERAVLVPPGDQLLAQALADVATIGILQQRSAHRSAVLAEHLQRALNSRVVIEQAKGILAERNGLSMEAAFAALRLHARDQNIKLTDLAVAVVHNDFNPMFPAGRPAS